MASDGRPRRSDEEAEASRLRAAQSGESGAAWYEWGPYLSDRQWGTVREDYSANGDAWGSFPHDMARSRAYRWGEDGIGGVCDREARLCVAAAVWNGRDPILKERLFGLANGEGNHGEDVKEVYYYLDASPTASYLKMLYKYPQASFPYEQLVRENAKRGFDDGEYELTDTGVFDEGRYFDVVIEYAKASPSDILMRVTVTNRGPRAAKLHVIPQVWFRNTWSWTEGAARPLLTFSGPARVWVCHAAFEGYEVAFDASAEALMTDNDSNPRRLGGRDEGTGFYKDAFHEYLVSGRTDAVRRDGQGTKLALVHRIDVPAGDSRTIRVRLGDGGGRSPFDGFDDVFARRIAETDAFYEHLQSDIDCPDRRSVQRQALAGMIWTKQCYRYDVERWLAGDPAQPAPPVERERGRNSDWTHLNNSEVLSMPDTWEYPWYAAWDLAFHCIPLAMIDAEFAKDQLQLMTREWYMHPNGQIPAYEWNFSDVNPPVHAWATYKVFVMDRDQRRLANPGDPGDLPFLEAVFHKMLLNFTWWVNRKDAEGRNVFQGGFLGLDNIGVFDRSAPLPTGGYINQSDGTSWMAMYCLNMMRISIELALHNRVYEDIATKFFEHFLHIADAMTNIASEHIGLWDEQDEFYYDVLTIPYEDGSQHRIPLRVRSLVGLIPLFAVEIVEPECLKQLPAFARRLEWVLENKPELASLVSRWHEPGRGERRLLSLLRGHRMKCLLRRMLDESEFLSAYGVRGLSKVHEAEPYVFEHEHHRHSVRYAPGESTNGLFGGNSNWRGPIWFPTNYMIVESLREFHRYYGDDFVVEHPTGSGEYRTLMQIADDLAERLVRIFTKDENGRRPVYGHDAVLREDAEFREHVLFYEYFHGDTGRGVGASHQTGWTGLVAELMQPRRAEEAPDGRSCPLRYARGEDNGARTATPGGEAG